jgi:hypothetical protein
MKSKELYGLDIATQWEKILDIHVLKLAKVEKRFMGRASAARVFEIVLA